MALGLLAADPASAGDGSPARPYEKTVVDIFVMSFLAASRCPDLEVDVARIDGLRASAGLPADVFAFSGSNSRYISEQIATLSPAFERDRVLACAIVYSKLGPASSVQPPIIAKRD